MQARQTKAFGRHALTRQSSALHHKWLEDLIALAQERSFSRVAELRHVTRPQFSRRIRAPELWAGADLGKPCRVAADLDAGVPDWLGRVRRYSGSFRLRILTGSIYKGAAVLQQGVADYRPWTKFWRTDCPNVPESWLLPDAPVSVAVEVTPGW